jgi:predicted SAM-dependent methyltransferase
MANYCILTSILLDRDPNPKELQLKGAIRIDIGGGKNPKKGFLSCDMIKTADVICDLETGRIPLPNESVDEIYSNHCFEHIENVVNVINECWRVMKWGSRLEIHVPHKDCVVAWQDPMHKTFWVKESMKNFCGEYLVKYKMDYGIRCAFKQISNNEVVPDGRPEYIKEVHFILEKNKEYSDKFMKNGKFVWQNW